MDPRRLQPLPALVFVLPLGGCILPFTAGDGADHYVVLGFGVVSTNDAPEDGVHVTRASSLGLVASDRPGTKLCVGWTNSTVVTVADGAQDVRIETAQSPFGALRVDAHHVEFAASAQNATPHELPAHDADPAVPRPDGQPGESGQPGEPGEHAGPIHSARPDEPGDAR